MVRRAATEALGTAFLLAAVVGSGIMAEPLAGGNVAIALLANTIASASRHAHAGGAHMFSEFVAAFGLVLVIWCCARYRAEAVAFGADLYITDAYWFNASTSLANPALRPVRAATDTFAGIRPADVPGFVAAQLAGAAVATALFRWISREQTRAAHGG